MWTARAAGVTRTRRPPTPPVCGACCAPCGDTAFGKLRHEPKPSAAARCNTPSPPGAAQQAWTACSRAPCPPPTAVRPRSCAPCVRHGHVKATPGKAVAKRRDLQSVLRQDHAAANRSQRFVHERLGGLRRSSGRPALSSPQHTQLAKTRGTRRVRLWRVIARHHDGTARHLHRVTSVPKHTRRGSGIRSSAGGLRSMTCSVSSTATQPVSTHSSARVQRCKTRVVTNAPERASPGSGSSGGGESRAAACAPPAASETTRSTAARRMTAALVSSVERSAGGACARLGPAPDASGRRLERARLYSTLLLAQRSECGPGMECRYRRARGEGRRI